MNFDYTLNREEDGGDVEIPVNVTGTYYRGSRGLRDSLGVPQEPDEPAYFEIESVTDEEGNEVEVSDTEAEAISEAGTDAHSDGDW